MGASNGCPNSDDDKCHISFGCYHLASDRCRIKLQDATEDERAGDDDVVLQVFEDSMESAPPRWELPAGGQLTVMLFGMAGTGKSSLGNLLAGSDVFTAGDTTRSVTNLQSMLRYEQPDGSLILLDTIGLGDSSISQEQVCGSIKDVAVSAPHGIDMLLYVMRCGRITDDTVSRLVYLTQYLWGDESVLNLYIVITWASRYVQNTKAAEIWLREQAESDPRFKLIYKLIGENPSRCIFVDIPSLEADGRWESEVLEKRRLSYDALLQRFCEHPRDRIEPYRHEIFWKRIRDKVEAEQKLLAEKKLEVERIQSELRRNFRQCMKKSRQDKSGSLASFHARKAASTAKKAKEGKGARAKTAKAPKAELNSPPPVPSPAPVAVTDSSESSTILEEDAFNQSMDTVTEENRMEKALLEDQLIRATSFMEVAQSRLDRKVTEIAQTLRNDSAFEQQVKQHALKQEGQFCRDLGDGRSTQVSKARSFVSSVGKRLFGGSSTPRGFTDAHSPVPAHMMGTLVACSSQKVATSSVQAPICIIFDWDDTLCPTWWLHKVLEPCLSTRGLTSFKGELLRHVNNLESILTAACKVAGHVAILTQATEGWLKQSLEYLDASGVDVGARLKSLNIAVHHADLKEAAAKMETLKKKTDLSVAAKKASMDKILHAHFGDSPKVQWHVLSVGDQMAELTALKQLCKEQQKLMWRRPICKTLKLPEEPMLEELGESLQTLASHLSDLISSDSDIDTSLADLPSVTKGLSK